MGRKLVFSTKYIQSQVDSLISAQSFRIGVLIGKVTEDRDYLLHLARLPEEVDDNAETESDGLVADGVKPSVKEKPSASPAAQNSFDDAWLVEHARQVCRMLPGGLQIIGIFVVCHDACCDTLNARLKTGIRNIYNATERSKLYQLAITHPNRYQFHISTSSRKWNCRSIDVCNQQNSWHPVELQQYSGFDTWQEVAASLHIRSRFHIPKSKEKSRIGSQALAGLSSFVDQIWHGIAVQDGTVVSGNDPLVKPPKGKSAHRNAPSSTLRFSMLLTDVEENQREERIPHCGMMSYNGWMELRAYLPPKATKADAVTALKLDATRSLVSRIELLCEESEINNMAQVNEWSLVSPRRVFAKLYPSTQCPISLCDYNFRDESHQNTVERFMALLDVTVDGDTLTFPEDWPDDKTIRKIEEVDDISDKEQVTDERRINQNADATRETRTVFIAGLVLAIVLAIVAAIIARTAR